MAEEAQAVTEPKTRKRGPRNYKHMIQRMGLDASDYEDIETGEDITTKADAVAFLRKQCPPGQYRIVAIVGEVLIQEETKTKVTVN